MIFMNFKGFNFKRMRMRILRDYVFLNENENFKGLCIFMRMRMRILRELILREWEWEF